MGMDATVLTREFTNRNLSDAGSTPSVRDMLGAEELRPMNAYWRAANYLSVGQIHLYDNPLLREPLGYHPNGLANGSDQVGRNYMRHSQSVLMALSKDRNNTMFQKTIAVSDL